MPDYENLCARLQRVEERLWRNITTRQPTAAWPEARQVWIFKQEAAYALLEFEHPELTNLNWRAPGFVFAEAAEDQQPPEGQELDWASKLSPDERQRMRELLGLD